MNTFGGRIQSSVGPLVLMTNYCHTCEIDPPVAHKSYSEAQLCLATALRARAVQLRQRALADEADAARLEQEAKEKP